MTMLETRRCVKRHYTKQQAKRAIKALQAQGEHGLNAYRCVTCNGAEPIWHEQDERSRPAVAISAKPIWHVGHPTEFDKLRKRGLV